MSDIEPEDHEEIARRLRDDGQAQAPPDLAGEVMKRVRSEPRRSTSAVRRPLVTLLAASLITVALVAGIAKLGGGGSGLASAGSSGGGSEATHSPTTGKAGQGQIVDSKQVADVPRSALPGLTFNGTTLDALGNATPGACPADAFNARNHFTVSVPYSAWRSVQVQLDSAKLLPYTSPLVTVQLHRFAPGVALRPVITCP
jgi:hypothetical protein